MVLICKPAPILIIGHFSTFSFHRFLFSFARLQHIFVKNDTPFSTLQAMRVILPDRVPLHFHVAWQVTNKHAASAQRGKEPENNKGAPPPPTLSMVYKECMILD